MAIDRILLWFHLVAAAVWTGGLIALGAVVASVRASGADRAVLRSIAKGFGRVSWPAMGLAVATGVAQAARTDWTGMLTVKVALVAVAIALAWIHQVTARRSTPAVRGMLQAAILLVSLAVFAAAVAL